MDGFWAFELERRGAREVVATDLPTALAADSFPGHRGQGRALGETFRVASESEWFVFNWRGLRQALRLSGRRGPRASGRAW